MKWLSSVDHLVLLVNIANKFEISPQIKHNHKLDRQSQSLIIPQFISVLCVASEFRIIVCWARFPRDSCLPLVTSSVATPRSHLSPRSVATPSVVAQSDQVSHGREEGIGKVCGPGASMTAFAKTHKRYHYNGMEYKLDIRTPFIICFLSNSSLH